MHIEFWRGNLLPKKKVKVSLKSEMQMAEDDFGMHF
jgi:hypothetical protein